ncbi:hypothetical protein JCM3770_004275 [Rhodotorula araucariae]
MSSPLSRGLSVPSIRKVTICDLPEEVLDLIADLCSGFNNWLGMQTLTSWTLVCRRFVASGQRAMCRNPIAAPLLAVSKPKAFAFLQTIRSHPHLGAAVRDLSFLAHGVERFLRRPADQFSSAIDSAIEPWSWQSTMLELCSQATSANVLLRDVPHAQAVGKLLVAGRRVQVLALRFAPEYARQEHSAVRALARALGGTGAPRMEHITITTSGHVHQSAPRVGEHTTVTARGSTVKRPHYNTRKLTLNVQTTCLHTAAAYIPRSLQQLRSLEIFLGYMNRSKGSLDDVIDVLHDNYLTSFSLPAHSEVSPLEGSKDAYSDMITGLQLPLALFSTFRHLRKLELRGCRGMNLARLAALADSSGATLTHLDLASTFWDLEPADLATDHAANAPSAFEADLIRVLDRFPRLRLFVAGLWPYADGDETEEPPDCRCTIRAYAETRGLRLVLEGCFDEPDDEDEYGYGYGFSGEGLEFYSDDDEWDDDGDWGMSGHGYAYGFF